MDATPKPIELLPHHMCSNKAWNLSRIIQVGSHGTKMATDNSNLQNLLSWDYFSFPLVKPLVQLKYTIQRQEKTLD